MEGKVIFGIGVKRVLYVELIAVAVLRDLMEFVPLRVWQFFLFPLPPNGTRFLCRQRGRSYSHFC